MYSTHTSSLTEINKKVKQEFLDLLTVNIPGYDSLDNNSKFTKVISFSEENIGRMLYALVSTLENGLISEKTINPLGIKQKAVDEIVALFNSGLLEGETSSKNARKKVMEKLNPILGKAVTSFSEFKSMVLLMKQGGNIGALGESFIRNSGLIEELTRAKKLTIEFSGISKELLPEVLQGRTRVIMDLYSSEYGVIIEIKTGDSFSINQAMIYDAIAEYEFLFANQLNKNNETGHTFNNGINELIYVLLPGPADFDSNTFKINEFGEYVDNVHKRAQVNRRELISNGVSRAFKVIYYDAQGDLWLIDNRNPNPKKIDK